MADVNNDSFRDIIIGYADSIKIYYLNKDAGLIKSKSIYNDYNIISVVTADLNNDGRTDIVVNSDSPQKNIYYQNFSGGLNKKVLNARNSYFDEYIKVGNLYNLHQKDLIMDHRTSSSDTVIYTYIQDTINNTFKEKGIVIPELSNFLADFTIGDITGDSKDEIIGISNYIDSLYIWNNQDNYTLPERIPTYEYADRIMVSDLNCDLSKDILVYGSGPFAVHENKSGSYTNYTWINIPNQYASPAIRADILAVGHLNGDKEPDLAFAFLDGVVIMKNISIPDDFSSIDSVIRRDTTVSYNEYIYGKYKVDSYDTVMSVVYACTDSVLRKVYTKSTHYSTDTIFIRKGNICGEVYTDTLFSDPYNFTYTEQKDSTFSYYDSCDSIGVLSTITTIESGEGEVEIYPNPADNKVKINFRNMNSDNISITIADVSGKVYIQDSYRKISIKTPLEIDISTLNKGIYELILNEGKKQFTGKFIKN